MGLWCESKKVHYSVSTEFKLLRSCPGRYGEWKRGAREVELFLVVVGW